jgi:hypothetical protein
MGAKSIPRPHDRANRFDRSHAVGNGSGAFASK